MVWNLAGKCYWCGLGKLDFKKPEEVSTLIELGGYDKPFLKLLFLRMVRAREFEEQLYYLFLTTKMPVYAPSDRQEAVAVGVASALRIDDYVTSTHRGHAHCIAKDYLWM